MSEVETQHGQDGVEALARVLCAADGYKPEWPLALDDGRARWETYTRPAERILADPGPLLAALEEAGILHEESYGDSICCTDPNCTHIHLATEWEAQP